MPGNPQEWLTQADYDFQTAEYMFQGARYVYAVFMAHLSIEKALKGIYQKRLNAIPPKTHNLTYLTTETKSQPPEHIDKFLIWLDQASVATRYPEELMKLQNVYTQEVVREILVQTKEALQWAKMTF